MADKFSHSKEFREQWEQAIADKAGAEAYFMGVCDAKRMQTAWNVFRGMLIGIVFVLAIAGYIHYYQ